MTVVRVPEPVGSFIEAINQQNDAVFAGAFTSSPFVDDWGSRYDGLEAIKAWSDRELLGANGRFTPTAFTRDDSIITVTGDWRSAFANGPSLFRFRMDGDKIASMTIREG